MMPLERRNIQIRESTLPANIYNAGRNDFLQPTNGINKFVMYGVAICILFITCNMFLVEFILTLNGTPEQSIHQVTSHHPSAPKECKCVDCPEDSLCGGLWKGVSYPADASSTHGNPLQSSRRVHIVVSHCKADLHWMSNFTNGFFNVASIHIITKCGQEVVGAPGMASIEKMQNVGRCDHSYARYINSILDTKLSNDNDDGSSSIVMFLKDDMSDQNLHQKARWNDYMTMIQVASSSNGFSCGLVHDKTLGMRNARVDIAAYYLTSKVVEFSQKQYTRRADMYEGDGIEFKSKWSNLGSFYHDVLNANPSSDVVQVCFGGTFAVLVPNIKNVDASVWRAAENALERGDSIEEGHFMERSWAYLLANPLEQYQITALLQYSEKDRMKFDQVYYRSYLGVLFRKVNQNQSQLRKIDQNQHTSKF